jgi:uncharacterized membrane-anchored protein YhcB (DUF1043 family)
MKRSLIATTIVILIGLGQFSFAQRRSSVPPAKPTEQEIEKRKRMMEERQEEYVDNFLSTLEADDFQKAVVKQYLDSYVEEKIRIYKTNFSIDKARKDAIKQLNESHFSDLKELISEDDMQKIKEFSQGEFDDSEVRKKKKKKRKNKSR